MLSRLTGSRPFSRSSCERGGRAGAWWGGGAGAGGRAPAGAWAASPLGGVQGAFYGNVRPCISTSSQIRALLPPAPGRQRCGAPEEGGVQRPLGGSPGARGKATRASSALQSSRRRCDPGISGMPRECDQRRSPRRVLGWGNRARRATGDSRRGRVSWDGKLAVNLLTGFTRRMPMHAAPCPAPHAPRRASEAPVRRVAARISAVDGGHLAPHPGPRCAARPPSACETPLDAPEGSIYCSASDCSAPRPSRSPPAPSPCAPSRRAVFSSTPRRRAVGITQNLRPRGQRAPAARVKREEDGEGVPSLRAHRGLWRRLVG